MRIVHLSDIHVWRLVFNPLHVWSKRTVGIVSLVAGRARKFRLERLETVVARVASLAPDHLLVTGDVTTTALESEFREAKAALAPLLTNPSRVTVIPGNHDRYTSSSVRKRLFERWFGEFAPSLAYPWLRPLDGETAILGLDATRARISARGLVPPAQLATAMQLVPNATRRPRRLIVANHYPLEAPSELAEELVAKRLKNAGDVADWLRTIGPHVYCCGHVHAAWAFFPTAVPEQLCLNAGAPLLRDESGRRPPGFLQLDLHGDGLTAIHHGWNGTDWVERTIFEGDAVFASAPAQPVPSAGSDRPRSA